MDTKLGWPYDNDGRLKIPIKTAEELGLTEEAYQEQIELAKELLKELKKEEYESKRVD